MTSEVCLEAAMASEAAMPLVAVGGNMQIDTRVIKVANVKSEVKWPPRLFGGRHGLGGHLRQYAHGFQGNHGC